MSTDPFAEDIPRYKILAKPKQRINTTINTEPYKVKRGALSYQITDTLNQLAQPKRKAGSALLLDLANPDSSAEREGYHRLINSNEQSKHAQESKKKKFLLDSYARITAARNKRCSKRLVELAKPKQKYFPALHDGREDFERPYGLLKKYNSKVGSSVIRQTKK